MLRRSFLLTPLALSAQPPRAVLEFTHEKSIPPDVARDSVVFGRAYACCAQPALARAAAQSGKFAHALGPGDPDVISLLRAHGIDARELDSPANPPRDAILIFAGAYGDGQDTPSERSLKVPLAIRDPRLMPRQAEELLISTVDLAPTLLGLCRAAPPEAMQGRDLSSLLLGSRPDLPDSVFAQGNDWRAVIRGYDKLVLDLNGGVTRLYNLADDPEERDNLAGDTASQLTRDALLALARVWMRRIGDGLDPSGLRKRTQLRSD